MLNKAQLIGNLGTDPEVNIVNGGRAVATFSVATNRRWKDREGTKHEETDWHQVVCWGQRAEFASKYLEKGRLVYIEGRLQTRSWDDQEAGVTRYRTEIVCQRLQLLERKREEGESSGETSDEQAAGETPAMAGEVADPDLEDDIPF